MSIFTVSLGPSFILPLINLVHAISFPFIYNPLQLYPHRALFQAFLQFFSPSISLVNFNIFFDPHLGILRIQHASLNTIGYVRLLFGSFASLPLVFNDSDIYVPTYTIYLRTIGDELSSRILLRSSSIVFDILNTL